MARRPLATLAAVDDPNVLDCELSAQLAEHRAVLATRPPEVSRELAEARHDLRQMITFGASRPWTGPAEK